MQYRVQALVFPTEEKHLASRDLFFKGEQGILDKIEKKLTLGFAQKCDFLTYLNACSWQKWKRYTKAKNLTLHLEITGRIRIEVIGYHQEALLPTEKLLAEKEVSSDEQGEVTIEIPQNDEQIVGFTITVLSPEATIYAGYFATEVEESELDDVTLCIATTTFQKEDLVKKNIRLIQEELLEKEDDLAKNTYLHVVDNGRTLSKKEIEGKHTKLHKNPNVGGSGGFARGMIESLQQKPKATHVLLMDDDVLVLPESIRRTYNLLKLLKPEYSSYFINGAMLYYEDPEKQHEDIGTVDWDGHGAPLKGKLNHALIKNILQNEQDYPEQRGQYGAWWFCCIPREVIERNGLPLPMFVRADDIEYAIRCQAKFITMNGICIWHMGFDNKYNAALAYQGYRNNLLGAAFSDTVSLDGMFHTIYDSYRTELMQFRYNAAETVIRAFEDFLKGPDFLREAKGEDLMLQNAELSDVLVPLSSIEGFQILPLTELWNNPQPSKKTRLFLKLTWNGQRWWPTTKGEPRRAVIAFNWSLQPAIVAGKDELLAMNAMSATGVVYKKDRKRFKELVRRYKTAAKYYEKHKDELVKVYRAARDELTSEEFWREYLGLESL